VSHVSDVDLSLGDLTIPSGTRVGLLMSELLKGDHWGDGQNFRPDRFLDEEGKCKTDEWLVPFSIGRRQCLGESLAKAELFLFFTGILQQFAVSPEVEGQPPSEAYCNGATVLPKPFKLRLVNRA